MFDAIAHAHTLVRRTVARDAEKVVYSQFSELSDENGNFQHMLRWRPLSISTDTHTSFGSENGWKLNKCIFWQQRQRAAYAAPSVLDVCIFLTFSFTISHYDSIRQRTTDTSALYSYYQWQVGWLRANVPHSTFNTHNGATLRAKLICFRGMTSILYF